MLNELDLLLDDPEQIVSTINQLPVEQRDPMLQRLLKLRPVLQTGGNLYLNSLTSLPAGFDKSGIKGEIYLKK
jgi:hypothetical protein